MKAFLFTVFVLFPFVALLLALLLCLLGKKLTESNSLIIFDEVQMFPQARAAIKYLVADAQKAIKAKNDGKTEGRTK